MALCAATDPALHAAKNSGCAAAMHCRSLAEPGVGTRIEEGKEEESIVPELNGLGGKPISVSNNGSQV